MTKMWKIVAVAAVIALCAGTVEAGTTAYKYDALGRVLLSTYPDGSQDGFSYDSAGNRSATRRAVIVPPTVANRLNAGQGLIPGASLISTTGCYKLTLQDDGNTVLTRLGSAVWNSSTSGAPSANLVMQTDGNAVVYGPVGEVFWQAATGGHSGAYLILQDDGNLVVYSGSTALWNAGTSFGAC